MKFFIPRQITLGEDYRTPDEPDCKDISTSNVRNLQNLISFFDPSDTTP